MMMLMMMLMMIMMMVMMMVMVSVTPQQKYFYFCLYNRDASIKKLSQFLFQCFNNGCQRITMFEPGEYLPKQKFAIDVKQITCK